MVKLIILLLVLIILIIIVIIFQQKQKESEKLTEELSEKNKVINTFNYGIYLEDEYKDKLNLLNYIPFELVELKFDIIDNTYKYSELLYYSEPNSDFYKNINTQEMKGKIIGVFDDAHIDKFMKNYKIHLGIKTNESDMDYNIRSLSDEPTVKVFDEENKKEDVYRLDNLVGTITEEENIKRYEVFEGVGNERTLKESMVETKIGDVIKREYSTGVVEEIRIDDSGIPYKKFDHNQIETEVTGNDVCSAVDGKIEVKYDYNYMLEDIIRANDRNKCMWILCLVPIKEKQQYKMQWQVNSFSFSELLRAENPLSVIKETGILMLVVINFNYIIRKILENVYSNKINVVGNRNQNFTIIAVVLSHIISVFDSCGILLDKSLIENQSKNDISESIVFKSTSFLILPRYIDAKGVISNNKVIMLPIKLDPITIPLKPGVQQNLQKLNTYRYNPYYTLLWKH